MPRIGIHRPGRKEISREREDYDLKEGNVNSGDVDGVIVSYVEKQHLGSVSRDAAVACVTVK